MEMFNFFFVFCFFLRNTYSCKGNYSTLIDLLNYFKYLCLICSLQTAESHCADPVKHLWEISERRSPPGCSSTVPEMYIIDTIVH